MDGRQSQIQSQTTGYSKRENRETGEDQCEKKTQHIGKELQNGF